ncbi:MAG: DUF4445 domain-containing protein [Spirochaetales bacterium]|nr:DUF4445 domain-containing protein [Spirochaetales bacterium]
MDTLLIRNREKTVLEAIREDFNIALDAPCGGKGTCGKCRVRIISGETNPPAEEELKHLSRKDLGEGIRLACYIRPVTELLIELDRHNGPVQILEDHGGFSGTVDPPVKKTFISPGLPNLEDQRDDLARILHALGKPELTLSRHLLKKIPSLCRVNNYRITALYSEKELLALEPGDSTGEHYALACDIGTTTVVAYLLDANSGYIIDRASELNAQRPYGADVIARIDYTMNNPDGLKILQSGILKQIEKLTKKLLERNNRNAKALYSITVAGNTTMIHLLAGIDPSGIAAAPFVPAFLKSFICRSGELGDFFIDCQFSFLPSISAYVGSDVVAGVLATGMEESDEMALLVDLGTNGEIVIGNRRGYVSCSTAAGPAFEGAHIQCGTGAVSGAVKRITLKEGKVDFDVVGVGDPAGICGSAIVDITAELLKNGIIDETGRLLDPDELEENDYRSLVNENSFMIVPERSIVFTQRDIREVQLAKAAISAGIETLLHEAGKTMDDIKHFFIAGGFGNYISKESAAAMGLIPGELLDRAVSVGNTAGLGAIGCALNRENNEICRNIVAKTRYIELSGSAYFQQKYMEGMVF